MSDTSRSELANRRQRKGLRQRELAAAIGVRRPYLSAIENGRLTPGTQLVLKLATALDCTPNTILKDLGLM